MGREREHRLAKWKGGRLVSELLETEAVPYLAAELLQSQPAAASWQRLARRQPPVAQRLARRSAN